MLPDRSDPFLPLQEALKGRYSLERELGRGGMGIVYLAYEVALDRPVALKLLPPALAAQPALRERFLREARIAARLSHPNIVPIFAVDQVGEFVFFAMAFIDGETLGQRIRSRGPLPTAEATAILRDVAWAVGHAHGQGVVHRDLKADNILLEHGSGRVLVTDFGIAQVRSQAGGTAAHEIVGTAEYMSPEQASGEAVDERSDVYSLGVVGYFASSGRLPFTGDTVSEVLAKHITQAAPSLAGAGSDVGGTLARAVDRCLAKDPSRRFQTAGELARALADSLEVRRDPPLPLRAFIRQLRGTYRSGAAWTLLSLWSSGALVEAVVRGHWTTAALGAGFLSLLLATPVAVLLPLTRRVLKAGYTRADVVHALSMDLDRQREELAFQFGRGASTTERAAHWITYGALGVLSLGAAVAMISPVGRDAAVAAMAMGGFTTLAAGAIAAHRYQRRKDLIGERWLRFWKSRLGQWLTRLAGVGVKHLPGAPAPAHRQTELAIGMAAERLFEDLPKAARRTLKDLPQTVRRLESHAQRMRARIAKLDPGPARETEQRRLADTIAALETIRLQLLRMHAGSTTVASLTTDLSAARDVADAVDRLLEGAREVEKALR